MAKETLERPEEGIQYTVRGVCVGEGEGHPRFQTVIFSCTSFHRIGTPFYTLERKWVFRGGGGVGLREVNVIPSFAYLYLTNNVIADSGSDLTTSPSGLSAQYPDSPGDEVADLINNHAGSRGRSRDCIIQLS